MTDENEKCCDTCKHYSPMSGLCEEDMRPHHGYEQPCSKWVDWEEEMERD